MIGLIVIVVGFVVAFFIEASHDKILADKEAMIRFLLKEDGLLDGVEDQQKEKAKWHKLDWWYLVVVSLIVAYLYAGLSWKVAPVLIMIASLKILVFNIRLNLLFGVDWFYLSSEGFEGLFEGGKKAYYLLAFIALIISTAVLIWFE